MKKILYFISLSFIFVGNIYADMEPASKYELSSEEKTQAQQLLAAENYTHEIESMEAYSHPQEIVIFIYSKPIVKQRYQQIDIFDIRYRDGKMELYHSSRKIKHELIDYYFYVTSHDISELIINNALEIYYKKIKNKSFGFRKAGKLRALYRSDKTYVLKVNFVKDWKYSLKVFLDPVKANRIIKTEITENPML